MLSLNCSARKASSFALALSAIAFLLSTSASASTVDYTFTGVGTALVAGTSYGPSSFTITLTEDPSTIDNLGGGYYRYDDVDAVLSSTYGSVTLTGAYLETNGNAGFQNVDLYDSAFTNGVGLDDSAALLGYDLTSSVDTGVVTGGDLTPTLGSSSFAIQGGGTLQFTSLTSLEFQAVAPTPEPTSLLLLSSGLSGLVFLRRRFVS